MKITKPNESQLRAWKKWVKARPPAVRAIAERLDPWTLYRLKPTGQRVTLVSIYEDGTVKVSITGQYNVIMFDRDVFGINPDDLEECDLPEPGEATGAVMTPQQVDENIDALRVATRPDLWTMSPDGKAVRKS